MPIWTFLRMEFDGADGNGAIGPHRANILEAIDRFGSLSAAAPAVDLTFRQLWRVVHAINSMLGQPVVGIRRSGRSSGAYLMPLGKEVLARFRAMQRAVDKVLEPHYRDFAKFVGMDPNTPPPIPRYAQIIDPSTIPPPKKKRTATKQRSRNKSAKKKSAIKKKPVRSRSAKKR
jgi:molybdate transport system regulatory protein